MTPGKKTFQIFRFSPENKIRLINLLAFKWKGRDQQQIAQKFSWRYEANPYASNPHVYLAEDMGVLAGFRAFILQNFSLGGDLFKVFIPADAIVHPSYRRQGIFSELNIAMLSAVSQEYPQNAFILNLTSNKMSRPGNVKQGWQLAKGQRRFHYKISWWNRFKSFTGITRTALLENAMFVDEGSVKYEISRVNRTRELAACRENNRPQNKLSGIRDEKFYTWRYAAPGAAYVFVYFRENEKLKGFLILRKAKSARYVLEEYFSPDTGTMKKLISVSMKKLSISVLKTTSFSGSQMAMFRQSGFFHSPDYWHRLQQSKHMPILVRPACPHPEENDFFAHEMDVRDMENWQLYQADAY